MSDNIYIARQPIVDAEQNIRAYELLFRSVQEDGSILPIFEDNLLATSRVLVNALNHIGINNLVDEQKAFVNIDEEMLLDNMITTIPKERFIVELLEDIIITDELLDRIIELKEIGYCFALDDAHCDEKFLKNFTPVFPYIDILKLDLQLIKLDELQRFIPEFEKYNFKLLAEKVETQEEFETYKALGCELFQGYYFAKPLIIEKKAIDPHYKNIFNLIKLLDKDLELDDLSLEFEKQADITLQLLRFMNSGQLHLKTEIKSIKHAISLLGKAPLKQWLLLIAYSKSDYPNSAKVRSPLLEMASVRSKMMFDMMESLHKDKKRSHEAAFVGLLSLMNCIVHLPIDTILDELHVDKEIHDAITQHKGELGLLLELITTVENFDIENTPILLKKLKLSEKSFKDALFESMRFQKEPED